MNVTSNRTTLLGIVFLIIIGSLVYSNTLDVPFVFDDSDNIENPALRMGELSFDKIATAASTGTLKERPVSNVSFAFNYYLGEYKVQGYHIVNTVIHLLAGIFLYLLLRVTLDLPVNRKKYKNFPALAYMTALIWVVHPLATQSVTYVVQRMNSMAAMFYVLSLLLYVVGRNRQVGGERRQVILPAWTWFFASVLSALLAMGSKEIAATLPFIVFLYEWYFFQGLSWGWIKKKLFWLAGVGLIVCVLSFLYLGNNPWRIFFSECPGRVFTSFERLMTQFRVIMHYITLLLYPNPDRLVFDYDFPLSTSLFSPVTTLYALVGIILLVLLGILLARRERLLSFCIFWFFINLAIESSIICLEMVFEHRTYLPSMFFLLFFTALLCRIARIKALGSLILIAVIILCSYWTYQRNKIWQNPIALWSDSVRKYPDKARSHLNLGVAFFEDKKFEMAEIEFHRALELKRKFPEAIHNLGKCAHERGNNREAEQYYRKAIELRPNYVDSRINLGIILWQTGREDQAAEQYREALKIAPGYPILNENYGRLLLRTGNAAQAMEHLETAIFWQPDDTELLLNIGEALVRIGKVEEAIGKFRKVIKLDPEMAGAHYNLAMLLLEQGKNSEALRHYRKATVYGTSHVPMLYNFANLLYRLGNNSEAESNYQKFIQLTPELSATYNNYGLLLMEKGDFIKATKQFEAAIRLAPENQLAVRNLRLAEELIESKRRVEEKTD